MPIYMVSFECKSSDKDYTGFFSKIKEIGRPWSNNVGSTWLIGHLGNASTIRDALRLHLDKEDRLLVAKLAKKDAAWSGFSTMSSEWLMRHLSYDVPPILSSASVWSPIPYPEEIGREETFY
ncbi:hypothetical protein [Xanthomonas campestris]|uniref:hypothetical protein n=2 Tax=Xanthomonas campestris TaxID=339 RepID=UPI00388ED795